MGVSIFLGSGAVEPSVDMASRALDGGQRCLLVVGIMAKLTDEPASITMPYRPGAQVRI